MKRLTQDAGSLTAAEQGSLACNQWRLVRHGVADVGEFYDLARAVHRTPVPGLHDILNTEYGTHANYARLEDQQAFTRFLAEMMKPITQELGMVTISQTDRQNFSILMTGIKALVGTGDPEARRLAQSWAEDFKSSGQRFPEHGHVLTGDPEVLRKLQSMAIDTKAGTEERYNALTDLCAWPTAEGVAVVEPFLFNPESGLDEKHSRELLDSFSSSPYGEEALMKRFQREPALVESHKDLVKNTYTFPAHREELDRLLEREEISAETRSELKAYFSCQDKATLAHLSDSIHRWLVKSGYQEESPEHQDYKLLD